MIPALVLLAGVLTLTVGLGMWQRRLGTACLVGATLLALIWLLANYAIAIDWRDSDGFIDCWPGCTAVQEAMAIVFWYTPVAAGILLLLALFSAIFHSRGQH